MVKNSSKITLADKIAGVLSTTPVSYDPEDDHTDDTRAKLVEDFSEDNEVEEKLLSKFRRQNIDLLSDIDVRYAGKKVTRKNLQSSDDESSEDQSEQDDEADSSVEDPDSEAGESEEENSNEMGDKEDSEGLSEEEESIELDDEEDSEDLDGDGSSNALELSEEHETNFKHFKDTDVSAQMRKGCCVRNQMSMWENLLEIRIQLQKCLIAANKMPQGETYTEIKKQTGSEFVDKVGETKNSLVDLLDKLLVLQKLSLSKYPETKMLNKNNTDSTMKEDDNEEIPSDTEDEMSIEDEEENGVPRKKQKLTDFEKEISVRHNRYKNYRNGVIQKWNDKTRIAVLKNNTNPHSLINHIEHTLSDRSKLIKRTQLKRSDYTVLGKDSTVVELGDQDAKNKSDSRSTQEYDTEIFDDDDFYHQLLRELIEVKSADLTDPVQLGRQWIQLQKLRSKMKRKIDTKATKGRKIRYTVHTKLVNFMAPIDEHLWTEESKTELFNSLFGKKG